MRTENREPKVSSLRSQEKYNYASKKFANTYRNVRDKLLEWMCKNLSNIKVYPYNSKEGSLKMSRGSFI